MAEHKTMEQMTQEAIQQAFAAQLLEALNGEKRDAILATAIGKFLGEWEFKRAIEDLTKARARKVCQEILDSGVYDARFEEGIRAGLELLLKQLPLATAAMFKDAMFGVEGKESYNRYPGLMLKFLKLDWPR